MSQKSEKLRQYSARDFYLAIPINGKHFVIELRKAGEGNEKKKQNRNRNVTSKL